MARRKPRNSSSSNGKEYSNHPTKEANNGKNERSSSGRASSSAIDGNGREESSAIDSNPSDNPSSDKGSRKGRNDPEWYAKDPQLLADAARIPFSQPFGSPIDLCGSSTLLSGETIGTNIHRLTSSPMGVCALKIMPSFGFAETRNDPLNVAANALYATVRVANSGRKNYDPADLMLYCCAFADIYSAIIWCQRLYALAFMYSQKNYYMGYDLIRANGVMPEDLRENMANFRYWLNAYINKVSSYLVPSDITYFKRRAFMFSNYYIENNYGNIKDQFYEFVPDGFFRFELDSNGAGKLQYQPWAGTVAAPYTVQQIINYMENLLNYVTGDEDFGLICGDISKAFGSNVIGLSSQPDEAFLLPVYDPYVLSQFKNADIMPYAGTSGTYTIDGNNYYYNTLQQQPNGDLTFRFHSFWTANNATCTCRQIEAEMNKVLSVENPEPGIGDVIEASRLLVCANKSISNGVLYTGTEVCVQMICLNKHGTLLGWGNNWIAVDSRVIEIPYANVDNVYGGSVTWTNALIQQFKYAPIQFAAIYTAATEVGGLQLLSNVDNYALIDGEIVRRLHECALLSLFYVPGIAKLV